MNKNTLFLEVFEKCVQKNLDTEKIFLLNDIGSIKKKSSYNQLQLQAKSLSKFLQENYLEKERVILLFPSSIDFMLAMLGCFYTTTIGVPLNVPNNKNSSRIEHAINDCTPKGLLTNIETLSVIKSTLAHLQIFAWDSTVAIENLIYIPINIVENKLQCNYDDQVAFIQYTSGSTILPKGVVVTHSNLIYNLQYIANSFNLTEQDVSLTWLPNYHDMGLVDGLLLPIYLGCDCYIISPLSLLKNPLTWLKSISTYKVTHSGGPNFCYDMCVRRIKAEDKIDLDLSSWLSAYNGAEPIMKDTLDNFIEHFSENGFKAESFYPCYGLAEATLMVTGCSLSRTPVTKFIDSKLIKFGKIEELEIQANYAGQFLVSSGKTRGNTTVRIVDPDAKNSLEINEVGEIWVSGPTVAIGYWNNNLETANAFHNFIADSNEGPFLRTGDLGFIDENGELFITGRSKDLIIINGENYYPQDIEYTAEKMLGTSKAHIAVAFDYKNEALNSSQIILVLQTKSIAEMECYDFCKKIADQVYYEHNIVINLILLTAQAIPKTTSGKVQRQACKNLYLENKLQPTYVWENTIFNQKPEGADKMQTKIENHLVMWIANHFNIEFDKIDKHSEFSTFYLDSIKIAEMFSSVEKSFNVSIPLELIYSYPSIQKMAEYLAGEINNIDAKIEDKRDVSKENNNNVKNCFVPDFEI